MSETVERYRWLVVAVFAAPLLIGIGFLINDRLSDPAPLQIKAGDGAPADIRVYIVGAVKNPGVYPAQESDRWIDALEAAGGPTADADLAGVNLARRVQDEDEIIVPRIGQVAAAAGLSKLVNINTGSKDDLMSLPGIGEVRAGDIVQSRTTDGAFASIDDLLARKLVPKSVFEDISALVTVSQ